MKPRRPDSAKSRVTQKTLDTQLNQSKFSQTLHSYTTFRPQNKDAFQKYVQQKNKDPKFKNINQPSTLAEIPQKAPKQQLSKINSKPFQKRNSKITQSKSKIQEQKQQQTQVNNTTTKVNNQSNNLESSKWTVNQPASVVKKQNKQQSNPGTQFNSQKRFAQKNKQKMNNSISAGLKKIQNEQKKVDKKVQLKGFKVTIPGRRQIKNNQEQKQTQNQFLLSQPNNKISPQKQLNSNKTKQSRPQTKQQNKQQPKKTQQQIKRQQQLLQISRFINQVQMKNIDYYPQGYQEFVQMNQSQLPQNLQKININDFLIQPTERDYDKIQKKINQNQKTLQDQENLSESRLSKISNQSFTNQNQQSSIDLDNIIDGDSQSQINRQHNQENQIFLSSISSKDLKQRNLFLTQVLKGRVSKQDIAKLQDMDRSQIKLRKLQEPVKQQDDDVQIMEINMMKKKSNRLFERNMVQASGQVYRDCDYLSEQNKLRLQRLLNGQMDPSPFEVTQWQRFAIRRIDQGIRLYRQLSGSSSDMNSQVIPQQLLPKDPNLRKQAERKILKQKIDSINSRLHKIQDIVISQAKIQSLIQEHRTLKISQSTQYLIDERNRQESDLDQKSKQALQMMVKAQRQKQQIETLLKQMQQQYKNYEKQCKQFQKLSIQQIVQRQKQDIKDKRKQIQQIQKSLHQIQTGTDSTIQQFHHQLQNQIQILKQIENLNNNSQLTYNLNDNQTVQNLNAKFQKQANQHPEVIEMRNKLYTEQEKQNQTI